MLFMFARSGYSGTGGIEQGVTGYRRRTELYRLSRTTTLSLRLNLLLDL
jgi:hypothetical protein